MSGVDLNETGMSVNSSMVDYEGGFERFLMKMKERDASFDVNGYGHILQDKEKGNPFGDVLF